MMTALPTVTSPKSSKSSTPNVSLCIVITGASSGLGAALARAYASSGVVLGLVGRNIQRLTEVAQACRSLGAAVEVAGLDVTDSEAMAAWLQRLDAIAPIDLLIANAGISGGTHPDGAMEEIAEACQIIQTNLLGVLHCVGPVMPFMVRRGHGQIAVVTSVAAYRGLPDSPAYCASKAGVLAYGESLRGVLEPVGVRVSVIVPGFFASPMSSRYAGHKLFLLTEAQAVRRVMNGLRRRHRRIVFPRRMAMLMRLADLIPAWVGDRLMRAFAFRIVPRND